jgi:hypothetical protein
MTMAVCFKCGVIKFGAFVPCPDCAVAPRTEDDLALSVAMTDHYFDLPTLKEMGAGVRAGRPPRLDPETRARIVEQLLGSGMLAEIHDLLGNGARPSASAEARPGSRSKPWWKFW